MKKIPIIVLVICVQTLLVFFEVHKQSQITKVRFQIQSLEQTLEKEDKEQRALSIALEQQKQPHTIYEFAKKNNMKAISLADLHTHPKEQHA